MTEKILAGAFFLTAAILGFIALDPLKTGFDLRNPFSSKRTFAETVAEDLDHLRQKKILPTAWGSIQYSVYNFNSDLQRKLVGTKKFRIEENPQGKYRLEIELIDVPDDVEPSIILQMSLFDVVTKNKVWELGRTYSIVPYLKKEKKSEGDKKASATASDSKAANAPSNTPAAVPATPTSNSDPRK